MTENNSVNTYIVPTTTNEVTLPAQPAFLAYLGAGDTDVDVTGNGTGFRIGSGNALTEVFDQNADFATTGFFTAPVNGRYFFTTSIMYTQAAAGNDATASFVVGGIFSAYQNGAETNAAGEGSVRLSILIDMDAADTCEARVNVSGIGADTADVLGSATLYTYFGGSLVT